MNGKGSRRRGSSREELKRFEDSYVRIFGNSSPRKPVKVKRLRRPIKGLI